MNRLLEQLARQTGVLSITVWPAHPRLRGAAWRAAKNQPVTAEPTVVKAR